MPRLLLVVVLALGCAPLPRASAPRTSSPGSNATAERASLQVAKLGPFAGVGSGVRRIDTRNE